MGIELTYVLPVKDHLAVFNCGLCSCLVSLDGYVTECCGHCVCRGCFRTWTETQDSQSSAQCCHKCGVKIASGESDGVVYWKVQTLIRGNPLVHRMLSHIKVLCPCRFSARMCYWTGDYSDLKKHITTSHTQPTAKEQTSKSCMIPESASEHQEPTSWQDVEVGSQSERMQQRKSDLGRQSSRRLRKVQAMEGRGNANHHRMQKCSFVSIPGIPNKYNQNLRNDFNEKQGGYQSERGLATEGKSWSRGKLVFHRETSIGYRLNEFNSARSFPKPEYERKNPPSTSIPRSISPSSSSSSSSPDGAMNMDAQQHQLDGSHDISNKTFNSTKRCQGQAIESSDNAVSHRMNRRRSQSMPDALSKSKPTASNALMVSHRRLQSCGENSAGDTRWSRGTRGSSTETSMGSRSVESKASRSFHKSVEYQRQRPQSTSKPRCGSPSLLKTTKPSAALPDADRNTDFQLHHSGTALDASNITSKSTDRRPTNETLEYLKRIDGQRRKPLVNARTGTSMPTALVAPEVSASCSEMNARLVEKESSPSSRRVEREKKDVGSWSPDRQKRLDLPTIGSISSSSLPPKGQRNQGLASLERQANLAYKEGKYTIAHDLYTTAIDAYTSAGSPTDVATDLIARLYVNRAAVCIKQSMFKACVKDCDAALSLNKRLSRACVRKARALNEMGLFADAYAAVSSGLKDNPGTLELEKELANCKMLQMKFALVQSFLDVKKYEEARALLLETQSSLRCAVVLQCKADLGLGNAHKVLEALNPDILQNDFMGGHGIELLAEAHFQNGDIDQAIQEATRAQSYSPDRTQKSPRLQLYQDVHSLMLTGQIAAKKRRFSKVLPVVESLSSAISMCNDDLLPPKAVLLQKLYLLRSDAYLQAKEFPQCLDDTARVIALDDTCAEAWTTRVKALEGMRQYDLIAKELNVVVDKLDDSFLQSAYENALGQPASVDLYALFGVSRDASVEEIMVQFQIKVAECEGEGEGEGKIQAEMTEEDCQRMGKKRFYLEKGISILGNSVLRSQYDAGKNVDSICQPIDEFCYSSKSA